MTMNIPGIGEETGVEYTRMSSIGASTGAEIALDTVFLSTTATSYAMININEPNVLVKSIELQVAAVLTTSTGTFTIGDTADGDGYWTDTLLVPTTTGAVWSNMATSVGYGAGKLYTTSDVISLVKAGAAASALGASSLLNFRVTYRRGMDTDLQPST